MKHLENAMAGLAGAGVFARAGMLRPVSPLRLARIGWAAWRWGSSPATLVAVAATRWPDHTAIVDDEGSLTYRELDARADALAAGLAEVHRVGPDRGLAVMCRNHRGLVEGMLAAGRLGADVVLVNTELPAQQLAPTLARHELGAIVHDEEFGSRLREAESATPLVTATAEGSRSDVDALIDRGLPLSHRRVDPGDLVILTSGTTGTPKGVPRSPEPVAMLGPAVSAVHRLRIRARGTVMVCPPAFHGLGLIALLTGLATGSTVVLQRRFDAERVVRTVEEQQVRTLFAVPVMLQRLLDVPDLAARTGSLEAVLSGASQLSPVVAAEFMDAVGDVLYDGYGSSEIGLVTLATPRDLREAPGTVGRPMLGTSIRILDADGNPLPKGEVGEICVASGMTFDGYTGGGHKEVHKGHLSTGDLGRFDAAGRLFIEGRADDMIVSGGENVFPQPVEDVLLRHTGVADAAVVGVPDEEFGQRLRAYVVRRDPGLDEETLREHLRGRLTRYELPRDLVFVDSLPRNATGKLLRRELG